VTICARQSASDRSQSPGLPRSTPIPAVAGGVTRADDNAVEDLPELHFVVLTSLLASWDGRCEDDFWDDTATTTQPPRDAAVLGASGKRVALDRDDLECRARQTLPVGRSERRDASS
jgi:hypothetical protein